MQTLLPPKRFEYAVNLQPVEVENKNKNSLNARILNENITSAVDLLCKIFNFARKGSEYKSEQQSMHTNLCISCSIQ